MAGLDRRLELGMNLGRFAYGRDNNFNLVRLLAATAVLVSHCFVLSSGNANDEPLSRALGMTPGSIAVDIFFIASGFLVTASLSRSRSLVEFLWARLLRIFPGLLTMLVVVLVSGALLTTRSLPEYLTSSVTFTYLAKCATLFGGVSFDLPGVFERNPWPRTVNGSLWTLPNEVRMYAMLVGMWVLAGVIGAARDRFFRRFTIGAALLSGVIVVTLHFVVGDVRPIVWLFHMFFVGAAFFMLREHIRLTAPMFWTAAVAVVGAGFVGRHVFVLVYLLTIAYLLFYLVYVPNGWIRRYNEVGDYSYGIYIYAFPVQQTVAATVPGASPALLFVVAAPTTLMLAALSWHAVERPASSLKRVCVERMNLLIGRTAAPS